MRARSISRRIAGDPSGAQTAIMENSNISRRSSEWLTRLRREFVRVTSRRVEAGDVEDVVQEAMRIIAEKGIDRASEPVQGRPPVAWCFQVLRNTIGNYYQRERTRRRWVETDPEATGVARVASPLESLDSQRTLTLIETTLADMMRSDPTCAGYLLRIVEGERAGELAASESIERGAFYRRLYRCRQKLRELLNARGVAT